MNETLLKCYTVSYRWPCTYIRTVYVIDPVFCYNLLQIIRIVQSCIGFLGVVGKTSKDVQVCFSR